MPRYKPVYEWSLSSGPPLKAEPSTKRVTYKGARPKRISSPPKALPKHSTGQSDVAYGSHKAVDKIIATERLRIGL